MATVWNQPGDGAACDLGRVLGDVCGGKGLRVGETHVAVEPAYEHEVVGCHIVDPLVPGQLTAPLFVIPITCGACACTCA